MEYKEDEYLLLSGLQHFVFCRRQWALIHIEQQWDENYLTASGRIVHNRVHDRDVCDIRGGIITIRGMQIKSAILGLTGECDAVEFIPSEEGITLYGKSGKWTVCPVEYKNGSSKINDCDRLQTAAQVMCLEEMFNCEIKEAHIYYNKTRRREKFYISDDLRENVRSLSAEMYIYFSKGHTPSAKITSKCSSCSLKDVCMPKLLKRKNMCNVSDYISKALEESKT